MTSALPPLPPLPQVLINRLPPATPPSVSKTFETSKERARATLLEEPGVRVPLSVRRHQALVLDRVIDRLGYEPHGHRLYVLEIAGPCPRVKVGASRDVVRRIKEHIGEMNSCQHGVLDAHVTDALGNARAVSHAEAHAQRFMNRFFTPMTSREHFTDADFFQATVIATVAFGLSMNVQEPSGPPV